MLLRHKCREIVTYFGGNLHLRDGFSLEIDALYVSRQYSRRWWCLRATWQLAGAACRRVAIRRISIGLLVGWSEQTQKPRLPLERDWDDNVDARLRGPSG